MTSWGTMHKIGEVARPSTYQVSVPLPEPVTHEDSWQWKARATAPFESVTNATIARAATGTAAAWLAHPSNKMQLPSLHKEHDADGDGVVSSDEFTSLLKAAGSSSNANALFAAMDVDGDGFLTEAEIKALGQGATGRTATARA